jgi:methionyl-tRNA formyltransferase
MLMDAGLDTGPMLRAHPVPIDPADTTATLHDRLAGLGARLIVEALEAAVHDEWRPVVQPAEGVCYAHKIDKAEACIDWRADAEVIERRLRAFDPQPGCHFDHGGETVKLWRAKVSAGFLAEPGTVRIEGHRMHVACGRGALELLELQRPGGRRVTAAAFIAARSRR